MSGMVLLIAILLCLYEGEYVRTNVPNIILAKSYYVDFFGILFGRNKEFGIVIRWNRIKPL